MRAKRHLGQNFLSGSHYPDRILKAVAPAAGETIVEIGPGHGALTAGLVESGARVIAIELDSDLVPALNQRFASNENFSLIQADAMEVDICGLVGPGSSARVVANLPYYISTPILQRLIAQRSCITEMTLMLQREVVDRLTAPPGGKEYGYLTVLAGLYCRAERLFDVPPGAFRPAPKVHSSVIRLSVLDRPSAAVGDDKFLLEVASSIFGQRRKTVLNNLRASRTRLGLSGAEMAMLALETAGIDPQRRAETLSIAEIAALADALARGREKS